MTDSQQIANGLNEVFSHRQSFIVVALTGRTGSGCSTVAKLLSSKTHNEVPFPDIPVPPKDHEDRKDRIIHNWLKQHWHPFQPIQVSQIILLLALSESYEDFSSFIKPLAKKNDLSEFWRDALSDYEAHRRTCETLKTLRSADNADVFRAYEHIFHRLPRLSDLIKSCLTNSHENA